jgi:hypothetical protein
MTPDQLRALADALLFRTHVTGPQFEEVRTKAASYLRACADAVPVAFRYRFGITDVVVRVADSTSELEPRHLLDQFGIDRIGGTAKNGICDWLYAAPVVAQPLTLDQIDDIWNEHIADLGENPMIDNFRSAVRAVERAVRGQP